MKSVMQILRQGKVKNVRVSAAASGLPTEEIETTVEVIQALIPPGLQAVVSCWPKRSGVEYANSGDLR